MLALVLCLFPLLINGAIPERAFYETNKGENLIYGDIVMTEQDKLIQQLPKEARMSLFIKNRGYNRWPNNVMPYEISSTYSSEERQIIKTALKELELKTCFRFPEKTSQHTDYIAFEAHDGCNSPLGRVGGKQVISLGDHCVQNYVVIHETMHAMGIHHEHQRTDRDNYVNVNLENVEPNNRQWLETVGYTNEYETNGFAYDIKSIMHYQGTAFGKATANGYPAVTMTIKNTNTPVPVNRKLTDEDINKIQFLGNCPSNTGSKQSTGGKQTSGNKPRWNKNKKRRSRGRKSRG